MIGVNLLPWREKERKIKNRVFYYWLLGCLLLCLTLDIILHFVLGYWLNVEQRNIHYLKTEENQIKKTLEEIKDLQTQKKELIDRVSIIQNLQINRLSDIYLLDAVPKIIPNGITLTSIRKHKHKVEIQGLSKTNGEISILLKNLENEKWQDRFSNIKLNEIHCDSYHNDQKFKLEFFLK